MPGEDFTVHVNRREPGSIEVPGGGVETHGSFVLRVENHGDPAHVHCRLRGGLATIATVDRNNYYVEPGGEASMSITVEGDAAGVAGAIEVSTRFGAHSRSIPVTVPGDPRPVDVDERLSKPRRERERSDGTSFPVAWPTSLDVRPGTVGVVALAVLALAVATAATVVVGGTAAMLGSAVVVIGIAVAAILLVS